jgi:hypothetical protein
MGTPVHSADFAGCLDAVTAAVSWDRPLARSDGPWRWGRGVAVCVKAVLTPTVANAVLQLNQDATATLLISTVEMGQGSDTVMAQIAAEVLCLRPGQVRVVAADTDMTPYDTITAGSRSTYHTGNAVRLAAQRMRDRLVGLAAARLRVPAVDCKLTDGTVRSGSTQRAIALPELIHAEFGALGTTLTTEANFTTEWVPYDPQTGQSPRVTEHWFAGAAAAELAVDSRTGRVRIRHLAIAADVGRAINPALVEQQLTGAAIMGLGQALFDQIVFDQGQMLNRTLLDYQLPSIKDLPERITPIVIENPHRRGPFGAKGVGETGIIPVAPAIGNAVRDATGVRCTTLPLTPERLLAAMTTGPPHDRDRAAGQRGRAAAGRRRRRAAARRAAPAARLHQRPRGLRGRHVRRVHGPGQRGQHEQLPPAGRARRRRRDHHRGGPAAGRPRRRRVRGRGRPAVRLLHPRVRDDGHRAAGGPPQPGPRRHRRPPRGEHLPLRNLPGDPRRGRGRGGQEGERLIAEDRPGPGPRRGRTGARALSVRRCRWVPVGSEARGS